MLATLARPYPQVVSGTPVGWAFDPTSKRFSLRYSTGRADGHDRFPPGSETDIATPALAYPQGYVATVVGGTVVSAPDAPMLRVRSAAGPGPVAVSVVPTGAPA